MAETASDILMDILIDWNVEVIFGLPGDGINGLMEALRNGKTKFVSFKCGMRKQPHSWRVRTPSIRVDWVSA
jgi:hypothetical protein